jgi:hypothetical protein
MSGDYGIPDRWAIRFDKDTGELEAVKFERAEYRRDLEGFLAAKKLHLTLEAIKAPKLTPKQTPTVAPVYNDNQAGHPFRLPETPASPAVSPAVSQPRPMAPIPARFPDRRPATQVPLPPAARASGRIEGFAPVFYGQEKGPAPAMNGNEAGRVQPVQTPSYTPRRSYNKPKAAPMIRWCQMQDALILVGGGTFQLKGLLLELGGRRSREKNADGTDGPWVWQLPAGQYSALQCAANENGIRLVRADSGRAA